MRSFVALLVIVFLALVLFSGAVFAEMIDVVYLKNGSVIKGVIIETIPNESIKIEIADGSVFVYQMVEVQKMTKVRKGNGDKQDVAKITKDPMIATLFSLGTGWFGVQGTGQIYNGQYKKAGGFFLLGGLGSIMVAIAQEDGIENDINTFMIGGVIVLGSYIWSSIDAYKSAKEINQEMNAISSMKLNYISHQGMMASYSMRF